jgi:hypothetical protein
MRSEWSTEDLVSLWTLVDGDWGPVANKAGVRRRRFRATRLGFAVLLTLFELEAVPGLDAFDS